MKNQKEILPYFFDKHKSEFCKDDFAPVAPEKFHFENEKLNTDLSEKIFRYKSKINNIVFYFVNQLITDKDELAELHLRIFSEDKASFYAINTEKKYKKKQVLGTELIFAKTTFENKKTLDFIPENIEDKKLSGKKAVDFIPKNKKDEELLSKINKTSIDTGTFWIYYKSIIQRAKITNVRDKLVEILSEFRDDLKKEIKDERIVQTLIDRTLFIKFLEDRHIINSYFYGDEEIWYKNVLESGDPKKVNDLFAKVQKIFNNYLFEKPEVRLPKTVLTKPVLKTIKNKIKGVKGGQLTLFDYKFDVIPIEAISLIYEIFIDKRREKGTYYTPKQLTNFITQKTIKRTGKIIDFACGSGSFLISAYKRLLELDEKKQHFNKIQDKINYRIKLIKENIFGIEKEPIARRLSVFSLYLSVLDDLSADENEELKELLKNEKEYPLFSENIGENIIEKDFFEPNEFDDEKFDFIIGNPPWKKDFEKEKGDEFVPAKNYLDQNKDSFSGKRELSELFLHKAKNWEKENTKYGIVVNTSNFTNRYSKFQDFFYKNFNIENFYEISDLDEIFSASEPAIVCIYSGNKKADNILTLNVLKSNEFSKLFKAIFVSEADDIEINQDNLIETENKTAIPLRNFLVGKDGDFSIINYLESNRFEKFENYILKDEKGEFFIRQGITIYGKDVLPKVYDIDLKELSESETDKLKVKFYEEFTSKTKKDAFFPYIKTKNVNRFSINYNKIELYLSNDTSKLRRGGKIENYSGNRIIILRKGNNFKASFVSFENDKVYPTCDLNTLKLNNENYLFYTAILNSKLVEYYLKVMFWQRLDAGEPRINQDPILQIPIPINKNPKIVKKIEKLSKQFTSGTVKFEDKENEFNELVYDLYGIGLIERQRIDDFFIKKSEKVTQADLEEYAKEFCEYMEDEVKPDVKLVPEVYTEKNLVKGISVVKIYYSKKGRKNPTAKNVSRHFLTEILKNVVDENILSLRSRIYGENTIYIVKDNLKKNWTLTKAGEDAIEELNKINKHNSKNK